MCEIIYSSYKIFALWASLCYQFQTHETRVKQNDILFHPLLILKISFSNFYGESKEIHLPLIIRMALKKRSHFSNEAMKLITCNIQLSLTVIEHNLKRRFARFCHLKFFWTVKNLFFKLRFSFENGIFSINRGWIKISFCFTRVSWVWDW